MTEFEDEAMRCDDCDRVLYGDFLYWPYEQGITLCDSCFDDRIANEQRAE